MEIEYTLPLRRGYRCYVAKITGYDLTFQYSRKFLATKIQETDDRVALRFCIEGDSICEITYEYMDVRGHKIRIRSYLIVCDERVYALDCDELDDWLNVLLFDYEEFVNMLLCQRKYRR